MDALNRNADTITYALCPLIPKIEFAAEGVRNRTEIRCVAALGKSLCELLHRNADSEAHTDKNIYLGCSDGTLMSYTLEESIDGVSPTVVKRMF